MGVETGLPIDALMRSYDLGTWHSVRLLPGGKSQHHYVATSRGEYVLRRSYRSKTVGAILFEHSLIRHLRQNGFPAPELVPTVGGGTWLSLDGRLYSMSVFVRGTSYQQGNREHLRQVAWALASYHRAAASFRPPCLGVATPFLPHGLAKRLQELSSWERPSGTAVDGHPLLRDALACVPFLVEKGREALRLLEETYPQLPPAVIHGGCRRGSAIFDGDRLVAMLDFDSARLEARALDLAVAVHDLGKVYDEPGSPTHKVALDLDRVREFLAAYQELSPLDPAELSALPAMLVAKRVRRALGRCHRLARGEPVSDGDLRKVLLETARVRWLDANGRELRDALGRPLAGSAQVERR